MFTLSFHVAPRILLAFEICEKGAQEYRMEPQRQISDTVPPPTKTSSNGW